MNNETISENECKDCGAEKHPAVDYCDVCNAYNGLIAMHKNTAVLQIEFENEHDLYDEFHDIIIEWAYSFEGIFYLPNSDTYIAHYYIKQEHKSKVEEYFASAPYYSYKII